MMNRRIIRHVVLAVCCCLAVPLHAQVHRIIAQPQIAVTFPKILGFNQEYNAATLRGELKSAIYENASLDSVFSLLRPFFLRFPGGTVSSFYNWRTQQLMENPGLPDRLNGLLVIKNSKSDEQGFLNLCRIIDAQPVFVLNVYQGTVDDQFEWVKREMGSRPVRYWELGNELNLYAWHSDFRWNSRIRSVDDYLAVARPLGVRAKGLSSGLHLGANSDGPEFVLSKDPIVTDFNPGERWNKAIAEQGDFYDAVSVHFYIRFPSDDPSLSAREQWLFSVGDELPGELSRWHNKFFEGRPLWLSEFGVNGRDNSEMNQWVNSLSEVNAVCRMIQSPGPLGMLLKHIAFSVGKERALFYYNVNPKTKALTFTMLPSGRMYQYLLNGMRETDSLRVYTVDGQGSFPGWGRYARQQYKDILVLEFFGGSKRFMVLLNRSSETLSVGLPYTKFAFHVIQGRPTDLIDQVVVKDGSQPSSSTYEVLPFSFNWIVPESGARVQ